MNSVPYQLSEGLLLENSNKLLPWYKSLHQITKKGGRPKHGNGRTLELFWESERILGGIHVSIKAMERGLGIFFLDIMQDKEFNSAQEEYDSTLLTLKEKLGEPTDTGTTKGYPWSRWKWGEVCVSITIAEKFIDYVSLSVSNGVIK